MGMPTPQEAVFLALILAGLAVLAWPATPTRSEPSSSPDSFQAEMTGVQGTTDQGSFSARRAVSGKGSVTLYDALLNLEDGTLDASELRWTDPLSTSALQARDVHLVIPAHNLDLRCDELFLSDDEGQARGSVTLRTQVASFHGDFARFERSTGAFFLVPVTARVSTPLECQP